MTAFAGLAILHASVAAALIEALLIVWRVRRPAERIGLRWLALLAPLVLTPAYAIVAPYRAEPAFRLHLALFSGAHWDVLQVRGLPLSQAATLILMGAGLILFVRDVGPWFADRRRRSPAPDTGPDGASHAARLDRVARESAARFGMLPPPLRLVAGSHPVLLCTGVKRPTIEVSRRTLDLLDDDALAAALLHEMVHVRHHDPLHGWLLIAVRALQAINPVAHVVARLIVQDLEARADEAVARLGASRGLAIAISRLSAPDERSRTDLTPLPAWRARLAHAQGRAVADRCERVLEASGIGHPGIGWLQAALASAGLAALLFLVV